MALPIEMNTTNTFMGMVLDFAWCTCRILVFTLIPKTRVRTAQKNNKKQQQNKTKTWMLLFLNIVFSC